MNSHYNHTMIAPTDRRNDRMYVCTVRSLRRSVARPIAAIGRRYEPMIACKLMFTRSIARSHRVYSA